MTERAPGEAPRARLLRKTAPFRAVLPRILSDVAALHRASAQEAEALLDGRLEEASSSPFYLRKLVPLGRSPLDVARLSELPALPPTTRAELSADPAALPAGDWSDLVVVKSSGTTGEPSRVLRDFYDCVYMWAVLRFFVERQKLALPEHPRVVLLCTLPGGLEYSVRLPLFFDGALHRLSVQRGDVRARLERVQPCIVFSDPAGLHWLAAERPRISPLLLLSSAQHLAQAERRAVRELYGAEVINYFSTTETGPVAWECLDAPGSFHPLTPHVHVESSGGRLLVTRLRPSAFPLLRYETGDEAQVTHGTCRCGYEGPSIRELRGREACEFIRADGTRVDGWQLAWLFKQHPLGAFVLTQKSRSRFELRLGSADAAALVPELQGALGRMGFAGAAVELLPLTGGESQKPRPFRCEVAEGG